MRTMLFAYVDHHVLNKCLIKTSFYLVKTSRKIEQRISHHVEHKQASRSGTRHCETELCCFECYYALQAGALSFSIYFSYI